MLTQISLTFWHQTIVKNFVSQCWHKYHLLFDTRLYWQISLVSADTNITYFLTPNYTDKFRYSLLTQTFTYCLTPNVLTNIIIYCWHKYNWLFDPRCTDKFHYSPLTQIFHYSLLTQNIYLLFDTKCKDKFYYSLLTQISLTVSHQM